MGSRAFLDKDGGDEWSKTASMSMLTLLDSYNQVNLTTSLWQFQLNVESSEKYEKASPFFLLQKTPLNNCL